MTEETVQKSGTRIVPRVIQEEMKQSYLDYSMSVIVGRALPDVRDGLKPVHRRVLFTMWDIGLTHDKQFKKSANVVGNCMARFHPHGDSAIYDTLVRLAQDFSMRYPLIDGQGNFGCFTADTKVKLTDGRDITFTELIEEHKQGKRNFTFTIDEKGFVKIAEIKNPRLTKKDQKLMKVVLDNGEEIKCTLNHKFMLRNGAYKEAQDLKHGDSLMPLNLRFSTKEDAIKPELVGYQMIHQPNVDEWTGVHVLADEWNLEHGVYARSSGKIRHHMDFNKLNNSPDNLVRMQWKDHWKLHAEHASHLHNNPEYRKKISEGRKKYWSAKENREKAAKILSDGNKQNWKDANYRNLMIKMLSEINIEHYKKHPELRKVISNRLKNLWKNEEYQRLMSTFKSKETKERWKNKDPSLRKFTSEESKKIWSNPRHREFVSSLMKEIWQNEGYRIRMGKESKERWEDATYRSKFNQNHFQNHFSQMAKKLWTDPNIHKLHSEKTSLQWKNPEFREKIISQVKKSNEQRLQKDPDYMKKLAKKASMSLRERWQHTHYKKKIIKNKILGYVNSLNKKYAEITPEIYEKERYNNSIPRISTALKYFDNFFDMVKQAETYNHKVLYVEILTKNEDVYDLTVAETHNFALSAGVFVHNSVDGDPAAAMRYTECRLTKLSEEMLEDIDKKTVRFISNFDSSTTEPIVLPSKLPNLLINGSSGIAVGMATNMPPNNVGEIIDAVTMQISNPEIGINEILNIVRGPDFPTGALICGKNGIREAYSTGRGKILVRAKTTIEQDKNKSTIIVNEIPFMVNKSELLEEIADMVRDKKVIGISDLRDESDRHGIRIVIELKKDADANVVLNQLFEHSRLQTTFGIIMLALVSNEPKILNIKQLIHFYIEHRKDVVRKRTLFDLNKAQTRVHVLEGLIIALSNISSVIKLIRESKSVETAKDALASSFNLTNEQAIAILEMRLQRLTSLEQEKIKQEHSGLLKLIEELESILSNPQKILGIIKKELGELKEKYNDARRTQVIEAENEELETEDLIKDEEMAITITNSGYIKRLPLQTYKLQHRGGKGVIAAAAKEQDIVKDIFVASTHSYILVFTDKGRVYWLKVYNVPEASRQARGKAIVNMLEMQGNEKVTAFVPVRNFDSGKYLIMSTKKGTVKKTEIMAYSNPRRHGIVAITLEQGDELINVELTDGNQQIILATKNGLAVRFEEKDVRATGRSAQGVRGISLKDNDGVIGMVVASDETTLMSVTENGYGKRTPISEYRLINRGGSGVINIQCSERNGKVVSICPVAENDDIIFISKNGIVIRVSAADISVIGRNTQGVKIMKLDESDKVVSAVKVAKEENNHE
ncbi:DNA gyrase subunit A [Candidatus Woesearchaeota archaeon]|nr:DNA gyrase subunit A [Candidatus Woesearchaeota archaeon]